MDINPYLRAVRALRALVEHDMAADHREGVEHCLELKFAISALQAIDGVVVKAVQSLSENSRETP